MALIPVPRVDGSFKRQLLVRYIHRGAILLYALALHLSVTASEFLRWSHETLAPGGYAIALLFATAGGGMWVLARRMVAPTLWQVTRTDHRSPIVFLRSFEDERVTVGRRAGMTILQQSTVSLERVIADVADKFGPLVALGRPGEKLPPLGAAREYLGTDADWQTEIAEYMRRATALIVMLGKTPGLDWEIEWILNSGMLPKVLLVLPPKRRSETRERWNAFRTRTNLDTYARLPPVDEVAASTIVLFDKESRGQTIRGSGFLGRYREPGYQRAIAEALARIVPQTPRQAEDPARKGELVAGKASAAAAQPAYRLFTAPQVGLSSLLGTSVAGALLIALNRRRLKLDWRGSGACLVGSAAFVAWGMLEPSGVLTTLQWMFWVPMWLLAEAWQEPLIKAHAQIGGRLESAWKAAEVGVAGFLAVMAVVVASIYG